MSVLDFCDITSCLNKCVDQGLNSALYVFLFLFLQYGELVVYVLL